MDISSFSSVIPPVPIPGVLRSKGQRGFSRRLLLAPPGLGSGSLLGSFMVSNGCRVFFLPAELGGEQLQYGGDLWEIGPPGDELLDEVAHLDGAAPGGLPHVPAPNLLPHPRHAIPAPRGGVHIGEEHAVPGVLRLQLQQPLRGHGGGLCVPVGPAGAEQGAPDGRVCRHWHFLDQLARPPHVAGPPEEIHHAAVVLHSRARHGGKDLHALGREPRVGAGREDTQQRDPVRLHGGGPHGLEQLHGLRRAAVVREPADHGAPGDHVPARHSVEHLAGLVEAPALGVHLHEGVAELGLPQEAVPAGEGVNPPPHLQCAQAGARGEDGDEGDVVRLGPRPLHPVEDLQRRRVAAGAGVSGDQRRPRDHRLLRHLLEEETRLPHLPAPRVRRDERVPGHRVPPRHFAEHLPRVGEVVIAQSGVHLKKGVLHHGCRVETELAGVGVDLCAEGRQGQRAAGLEDEGVGEAVGGDAAQHRLVESQGVGVAGVVRVGPDHGVEEEAVGLRHLVEDGLRVGHIRRGGAGEDQLRGEEVALREGERHHAPVDLPHLRQPGARAQGRRQVVLHLPVCPGPHLGKPPHLLCQSR